MRLLVRSWNVSHGNAHPPRRKGFLRKMVELASADGPDVLCLQEVPVWALPRIDDWSGMASFGAIMRPPLWLGPLSTWLTRIVVNQSLMRLRRQRRDATVIPFDPPGAGVDPGSTAGEVADRKAESPPDATLRAEIRRLIERRIDELPLAFRTVFILRDVDDMSVAETAAALSIPPATVRTRLFRARALLREALARDLDRASVDVFQFAGARCDRIVANVLARLAEESSGLNHVGM